ncbi:facilitated trehalose transporter Tret1-like [Acyrthosiphon pisum]|uniref:Major facilitator superfamily (MFS) profile domain-containing protein n=1 Tax=Acyrthosiphon pisum TaxID=7029 RepID=A0A8R2AC43_ACYPI|nr:facilitated trehalose transporter Tret1-like [Acyrthosiphon pisum]|eukprot:XP_003247762.1 PREDICTED: facilitated trehalose transporter Tret1-like [Acyrthosiphon pisum]
MTEGRFKTVFFTFSIALIACMGYMVCGNWIGWSSPATYLMKHNHTELDVTNYGMMVAMYDLGNLISPIPCGYFLGLFGRKLTISIIGPLNMLAWIAILVWPSRLDVLYAARLFAGLAKGMTLSSIPIYVGEIAEVKLRGSVLSMFPIMLAAGMLAMQTIGRVFDYRQLNMLGLFFSTVFTVLFFVMPESPYYLMQKGRRDQAEKSLRRIRAKDDVTDELEMIEKTVTKQMQSKATYSELFMNKSNRKAFAITAGASVFQRLSGISPFIHFSSITLPSTHYWMNPLVAVMVFTLTKSVGNFVPLVLVDWMGRKPLMVVSHAAMALVTAAYGVGLYVVANGPEDKPFAWWPVVSLWAYALSYSLGAGTLTYTLLGEMFAANVKTRAAPLCVMMLAGGSFVLDGTYTTIAQAFGVHSNYFMYSAFNLIWAVTAGFVMVETKGKTFLEIEEMLAS